MWLNCLRQHISVHIQYRGPLAKVNGKTHFPRIQGTWTWTRAGLSPHGPCRKVIDRPDRPTGDRVEMPTRLFLNDDRDEFQALAAFLWPPRRLGPGVPLPWSTLARIGQRRTQYARLSFRGG